MPVGVAGLKKGVEMMHCGGLQSELSDRPMECEGNVYNENYIIPAFRVGRKGECAFDFGD